MPRKFKVPKAAQRHGYSSISACCADEALHSGVSCEKLSREVTHHRHRFTARALRVVICRDKGRYRIVDNGGNL